MDKFKFYFKDKASDLLENCEKNKIVLPDIMKPPYQGLGSASRYGHDEHGFVNEFKNSKYFLRGKYEKTRLTSRQYDCLSHLAAGCTAKEAANKLSISHRTVENYLANLKSVFKCHRKSQ